MSIRDIIEAATPGPWERGDRWWIQGADHCECRDNYWPLVYEGCMCINGRMMEAHVHRTPEPITTDGITTAWLDERTHKPHSVAIETGDADARFIATFDPEHVALMEAVCEAACALPCCDMQLDFPTGTCRECVQEPVCASTEALQAYRKERGL